MKNIVLKKTKNFIRFFFILFILIFSFSLEGFCDDPLGEIILKSGELGEFAIDASNGKTDFFRLKDYFVKIFLSEFSEMKTVLFSIIGIICVSCVKECFSLNENISSLASICISSLCVLLSSGLMTNLFLLSEESISTFGDIMFLAVPYMCSLLAMSGKTLSAAKGSIISLGSANIISYLTENFFFLLIYVFYLFSVASSVIENDIFKSLKKAVFDFLKIVLPFIVGLYISVLTLFLKTSAHNDDFFLKTTKTLLSNGIPFLGNILNKSADTVLSSVEILKSQAGIVSTVAIIFSFSVPLVKLLCGMLVFKLSGIICSFFGNKKITELLNNLSDTAAMLSGITGTVAIIAIISIVLII